MVTIWFLGIEYQPLSQLGYTANLIGNRAQPFMEHNVGKFSGVNSQCRFLVQLPKEFGISQPRRQHFFIASNHCRTAIARINIGRADKGRSKRPLFVPTDKIFLVHPRGQLDNLWRHVQKGRIITAKQRHRPFSKSGIFYHQPFILNQHKACISRRLGRTIADDCGAALMVNQNMTAFQAGNIIAGAVDGDDFACKVEAVTDGHAVAGNAIHSTFHNITAQ